MNSKLVKCARQIGNWSYKKMNITFDSKKFNENLKYNEIPAKRY